MIYRIFRSVKRFNLRHFDFARRGKCSTSAVNGDSVCCTKASMETGARPFTVSFIWLSSCWIIPKVLLPRPFAYLRLIEDGSIASVVPTENPLIVVLSWGLIRIMLLSLASFSFSVSVPRSVVVLSFFLQPLHLSSEFLQISQQTLVGETECLHLVSIGL